ncbi:breast carcinoma amplified sequence 2 [Schizopora paradoxa]|uniref:Breast carcinoma amplified sequence 2 n=1 Tax=Schizopora paradoxa TaxID=27342 RepID=A0A0H2S8A9_9AGAM|nr:breast carcinoma amplified sequence 2 [Schizopora paradoxa]
MEFQEDIIDSLPYYDNDLEKYPHLRTKVEQEINRELKQIPQQSLHPRVPPPVTLFEKNDLLQAELKRVESHQPMPPLDHIRYQLPAPTKTPASREDWEAALKNAKAQLEHQRLRQQNIALLQNYGSNAWRIHNFTLEETAKGIERALEEVKEQTVEVNRERKQYQTTLGNQLSALENRWQELIATVLQIEFANIALEADVAQLTRRETELSSL